MPSRQPSPSPSGTTPGYISPAQAAAQAPHIRILGGTIRTQNIRQIIPLDENTCRKLLTEYGALSIRKSTQPGSTENPNSWGICTTNDEKWTQDEILKRIALLDKKKQSMPDVLQKLNTSQQGHIAEAIQNLMAGERDHNYEWNLVQIDQAHSYITNAKKKKKEKRQKQTSVITLYLKRAPRADADVVTLYNTIQKMNSNVAAAQLNQVAQQGQANPKQKKCGRHRHCSHSSTRASSVSSCSTKSGTSRRRRSHSRSHRCRHHRGRQHQKQCCNAPPPSPPPAAGLNTLVAAFHAMGVGGQQPPRAPTPAAVCRHRGQHSATCVHSYNRYMELLLAEQEQRRRQAVANARYNRFMRYINPMASIP